LEADLLPLRAACTNRGGRNEKKERGEGREIEKQKPKRKRME
jgi:hypothetical protein